MPLLQRITTITQSRYLARFAFIAALVLTLPSISNVMVFDDYVLGVHSQATGAIEGLKSGPFGDLFSFSTGDPEDNYALMASGALMPWWSEPRHRNGFLRPLSSLSHRLDFALFPHAPWLMHVHNWLWFVALLLVARVFYREVEQGPEALPALAFAVFAIDDPHGATLSWISNRNALIALTFAMGAVTCHMRYVRSGRLRDGALGPLLFLIGLLGGEAAVGALAYLLAHALLLETGAWPRRLLRLLPYAVPLVAWRVAYRAFELGSYGSDGYHDPLREPAEFLLGLAQNLPILLGAQLSIPYADQAFWGPPEGRAGLVVLSAVVLAATLALAMPLLRRSKVARFYLLAAVLAAIPVSASVPGQRHLLGLSFGACGFVALLLCDLLERADRQAYAGIAALGLFILHVPGAAFALPLTSRSMTIVGEVADPLGMSLHCEGDPQQQAWVIVAPPFTVFASYIQPMRAYRGAPRPAHLYWLSSATDPVTVTRTGPRSLLVDPQDGFIKSTQDKHYRRDAQALHTGSEVDLPRMTAKVLSTTADGRPAQARFTFDVPLEDPSLCFFAYERGRYVPWDIPKTSEPRTFPGHDLFLTLARHFVGGESLE